MSSVRDILDISDERNCDRRHQNHRYASRPTQTRNQPMLHDSSRSTKQTRLPARSWKRKKLTTFQESDDDLSDNELYNYSYESYDSETLTNLTIPYAINTSDADLLGVLLRQMRLHHDPKKYLGHRHCQITKRKPHTLLTHAIIRGDSECIRLILEYVFCGYIYPTIVDHVCSNGRTALWYACRKGDFDLVQVLVQDGHANINKCGVLIVATQNGHEEIVNYLLRKGCDPNRRAKNYNERALHAASRRNHLGIVNALLKYGADPTILDYKKRTALDYAIHKRHIDIAKVLICRQGGRFMMTQLGFTPLMLAARCDNSPIVDILLDILPRQQILDELALLACHYTIYGIASKRDQAYCYFESALSMTKPSCNSAPCEAYEFLSECQTLDELALIRENDNAMRMHALLVCERLLLKSGEVNHLISFIIKQSDVYKWYGIFHRCLQLCLHAYQLMIQTEHKDLHKPTLHRNIITALMSVLFKILTKTGSVPVESLALVWKWILNRADKALSKFLFKLICITTYLIETKKLNGNEQRIVLGLVRETVYKNVIMADGNLLLGYCIKLFASDSNDFEFDSISVPTLSILRLLIHCGANVDEPHPLTKSTPLHLACELYWVDNARSLIRLLLDANAHTDCIDARGYLPEERTCDLEIEQLLRANRKLSLKCRCAQLIYLKKVGYVNCLPSNLIAFVRMHSRN